MTVERPRLDSWKEIAQYLGRDVRTVIRWERDRGLPVARVPGGKRSRVFTYQDDLDEWLARAATANEVALPAPPATERQHWSRPLVLAGIAAAVLVLASFPNISAGAGPVRLTLTDTDLQALGARNELLWSRRLTADRINPSPTRWSFVGHLDGDPEVDVLAAVEAPESLHEPVALATTRLAGDARLWRFTAKGDSLWSHPVNDRLQFRDGIYEPPWALSDLTVHTVDGQRRVAWAVHHFTWWPSMLISLDADGRRLGTFVNGGWIRTVEATLDGRHILVSGISNAHRSYFLAVLDASSPFGRSPEPPGSATECLNCDAGDPIRYFVWPRTDISTVHPFPADGPSINMFANGDVHIQVHETVGDKVGTTIYLLTPAFEVQGARFSDAFWDSHDLLHRSGAVNHTSANCPERTGREVKVWTRATGWQTVAVASK